MQPLHGNTQETDYCEYCARRPSAHCQTCMCLSALVCISRPAYTISAIAVTNKLILNDIMQQDMISSELQETRDACKIELNA